MAKLYVWRLQTGHYGIPNGGDSWIYYPNAAGGCSVRWCFQNATGKTIKYASFWFTPYNAVNDTVICSISGKSTNGVRYTGPLEDGKSDVHSCWENAWYNSSIVSAYLENVYIEYMDGTKENIPRSEISFSVPEGINPKTGEKAGCYVATAVYGSYDCPQVWTLRRYRDNTLAETWCGRAFIKTYYAISPTLVKWFGNTNWFKNMWRNKLDRMVKKLQSEGVESTPYEDKNW